MDNKTKWELLKDRIGRWLIYRLPHKLIYWALIRATEYATSPDWQVPRLKWEEVTASSVIGIWHAKKEWKEKHAQMDRRGL